MTVMANPYFRFKQFTVFHDRCAMKVGTDGVLLGAWTAIGSARRILDIGCGSGLIALMLAQRSQARIDAVDIDHAACVQAEDNCRRSPWAGRIRVYQSPVQSYTAAEAELYDLAVVNPPFFDNACKPPQPQRQLARHGDMLSQTGLLAAAGRLLAGHGRLALIYPPREAQSFQQLAAASGWHCRRRLAVKSRPDKTVKRILEEYDRASHDPDTGCQETTLVLEQSRHVYTAEFIDLIKDFYLKY